MRVKLLIFCILSFITCMISCKKAPLSIGAITTETRQLDFFDKVKIHDNINLTFVKSDTNYVVITTGNNLIDNILTEINAADSTLTIKNGNALDWLRPYEYQLNVELHFKDINYVYIATSGTVTTENQFNSDTIYNPYPGDTLPDQLKYVFEVDGASGNIDIELNNCPYLYFNYEYGTSNVKIRGNNNGFLKIRKRSFGDVNALDYQAERVTVVSNSLADCHVSVGDRLVTRINNIGNIYYRCNKNEPPLIDNRYGPVAKGKLIKL